MKKETQPPEELARRRMSPLQKGALVLLVLFFVGSVLARAMKGPEPERAPASAAGTAFAPDRFLPGQEPSGAPAEEPGSIEGLLPLFTEGSFFALIGFALGYATRKIVKLLLIFVAIFFAGVQALAYAGVMTVDWGLAIDLVNRLVLNIKENQPFTEVLEEKVPTVGALIAGYFLGFRRG